MEIKTLASYGEIVKNSYITPFVNNSGCIVLVVNAGTSTKNAYKDAIAFERSSGFKILAQPRLCTDFTKWLMSTVIRQFKADGEEYEPKYKECNDGFGGFGAMAIQVTIEDEGQYID